MFKRMIDEEPARLISRAIALVIAILDLLVAFGVVIDESMRVAITGMLTAFLVLVLGGGEVVRSMVYSPATVRETVRETQKEAIEDIGDV